MHRQISNAASGPPLQDRSNAVMLRAGQSLSLDNEGAFYRVLSGVLLDSVCAEDGRRWVAGIHREGALFWTENCTIKTQNLSALSDSYVTSVTRASFRGQYTSSDPLDRELDAWRKRRHMMLMRWGFMLARSTSVEKLSFFILELMDNTDAETPVNVLMSREEIGDHLGLTSETVTRTFTLLDNEGLVRVDGKLVKVLDRCGLFARAAQIYSI